MALEQLLAALERDARAQTMETLERARREADAILTDGRARMTRDLSARLGALEAGLADRSQRRILAARRAALRSVLEARQRLFDEIVRQVSSRLPEVQGTEAFRAALTGWIEQVLGFVGDEPAVLSCPPPLADEVKRAIGDRPGVKIRIDETALAGVRVETADGAVLVDGTLAARLEQLRPALLIEALRELENGP